MRVAHERASGAKENVKGVTGALLKGRRRARRRHDRFVILSRIESLMPAYASERASPDETRSGFGVCSSIGLRDYDRLIILQTWLERSQ